MPEREVWAPSLDNGLLQAPPVCVLLAVHKSRASENGRLCFAVAVATDPVRLTIRYC